MSELRGGRLRWHVKAVNTETQNRIRITKVAKKPKKLARHSSRVIQFRRALIVYLFAPWEEKSEIAMQLRNAAIGLNLKSWRRDLNPRPTDYKSVALPAELRQPERVILTKPAIRRNAELPKYMCVYTMYGIRALCTLRL